MASATEIRQRAGRAFADARHRFGSRAAEIRSMAREIADDVGARVESSRASAGPEGWRPARLAAGAAGAYLVWRAVFGRGLARIPGGVAGLAILRKAFPRSGRTVGAARSASGDGGGAGGERRRSPEVVEVKGPAELEAGGASGSPQPTFSDRADQGPNAASGPPTDRKDQH